MGMEIGGSFKRGKYIYTYLYIHIYIYIYMYIADWRRKWQPTPVFLPGKSHGWRRLVSYSPWGSKESDMTE